MRHKEEDWVSESHLFCFGNRKKILLLEKQNTRIKYKRRVKKKMFKNEIHRTTTMQLQIFHAFFKENFIEY